MLIFTIIRLGTTKSFQVKDTESARSTIAHFVTSRRHMCLWPIVKRVRVKYVLLFTFYDKINKETDDKQRGPFSELSSGARLIDLPGIDDTCKARVKVMQKYLDKCSYLWVLSDIQIACF